MTTRRSFLSLLGIAAAAWPVGAQAQQKIVLKASDVHRTVEAYRLLAQKVDYPFHLGVTEAGTSFSGTVIVASAGVVLPLWSLAR